MAASPSVMLKVSPWGDEKNDEGDNFRGCGSWVNFCSGCSRSIGCLQVATCSLATDPKFSTTLAQHCINTKHISHYKLAEHMAS